MLVVVLLAALMVAPTPVDPPIGRTGSSANTPPAVTVAGARSVSYRDDAGGLSRTTLIPSASAFAGYQGGSRRSCTLTADRDGFVLSNGDVVPEGTVVTAHYVFIEGINGGAYVPPVPADAGVVDVTSRGSLEEATRTFSVFCDSARYVLNRRGIVVVRYLDVFFGYVAELDRVRNDLRLVRPVVFENPVVRRFGGLVTRYPAWLAVGEGAWRVQQSVERSHRGAPIVVIAEPRELDFTVAFSPNPDKPSPAFTGVVDCVTGISTAAGGSGAVAVAAAGVLPAMPRLPEQTTPGVNGPCMWTPPGPGSVTITARITYTVTYSVDGFTMPDDDYTWSSLPTVYDTGELIAVNTKP